ncbi:hypothetical protein PR202_ga14409 [Eleusine coracana subsp. coracana]|uniref:Uncharacterized protein n=1 Tax=Eleusine coracana subsp. coracana TaxID=191504 RepID=A0AAV5CHF2_ELECO|nr:hypothetical protein PR202_ga14409 [Eleusine coracana subsp. coracana]
MAALGRLVLVTGLIFLLLNAQETHGAAEEATTGDVAAVQVVPESTGGGPPVSLEETKQQRILPPSGPSENLNFLINHDHENTNMSSAHTAGPVVHG